MRLSVTINDDRASAVPPDNDLSLRVIEVRAAFVGRPSEYRHLCPTFARGSMPPERPCPKENARPERSERALLLRSAIASRKQLADRFGFHQLARLVEVVVDDRFRINSDRVIN